MLNPSSPGKDALIPANYSRLMAQQLGLQARQLPQLLAGTGLGADELLREDWRLTTAQQLRILDNAVQMTDDPVFGLRLGKRLTPSTHGAVGVLASSSPDLLTALRAIRVYLPTRLSFVRMELHAHAQRLELRCAFDAPLSAAALRTLSEACVMVFSETAAFIVGRPLEGMEVGFPHARPDYAARYAEHLPGEQTFGAAQLTVRVPLSVCREPNVSANQQNYLLAQQQCEAMLAQLQADRGSTTYRVQRALLSHPAGMLSEDEVAAALFVSKRTLARRLRAEQTGFRQVRDGILAEQAAGYLQTAGLSVEAIAALLGYHDASNFRRAFRRWFGMSPNQYRENHAREPLNA